MSEIYLHTAEDLEKLAELNTTVTLATRTNQVQSASRRMGDGSPDDAGAELVAAKRAFNAFLAKAKKRAVCVVIGPLDRREWRTLTKAHPAREDEEFADDDRAAGGFNEETFPDALMLHPGTVLEIRNAGTTNVAEFLAKLPHGKFNSLYNEAYRENTGDVIDPKAFPVSATTAPN